MEQLMNAKEMIMKRNTIAQTFAIATVTRLGLGIAPTAKADNDMSLASRLYRRYRPSAVTMHDTIIHARRVRGVWRSLVAYKASGLVGWLCVLCPAVTAQKAQLASGVDPLVAAIENIKQSVVSVDCLSVSPTEAKIIKRIGSAFVISESGDFLTAAHVLAAMQKDDSLCPTSAITLPIGGWRPEAPAEKMLWFPFKNPDCKMDSSNDVAECRLSGDLQARIRTLHLKAVQFEWDIPTDGTQVAFTGFPLEACDPMTFRAHLAAYRLVAPQMTELVLDHDSLPGYSGSPVYLADGSVVAILVRDGKPEATGTAIARPVSAFREMLIKTPAR